MVAKYPDQSIEDLWPEQWACFQHIDATFQELIAENTKLDRERNEYRNRARKYAQKVYAIESLFVVPSDNHELTLKAIKTIMSRQWMRLVRRMLCTKIRLMHMKMMVWETCRTLITAQSHQMLCHN